jgi:hypothetical protein
MATTIKEFVTERGIKFLMHFTRAKSLESIISRGLVPRSTLVLADFDGLNDPHRIDGTDAVCLSIGFPNYKMFYRIRQDHPAETWVVLVIHRKALWDLDCAFCTSNAASKGVTAIPLEQRKGVTALRALYADWPTKPPSALKIPDHYPTNPQAEVLALQGVPRSYIVGIYTPNEKVKEETFAKYPTVTVLARPKFFSYRDDFEDWKAPV